MLQVRLVEVEVQCGPDYSVSAKRANDCTCSRAVSGPVGRPANDRQVPAAGYQVPFAEAVKADAGIATMAVDLTTGARQAEDIVPAGRADMVALGRELHVDQNWAHEACAKLEDSGYAASPAQYGWWLEKRPAVIDESTAP